MAALNHQSSNINIKDYTTTHVNPFIGTGANGCAIPVASVPHGMVHVAPDTRETGSGYYYYDSTIIGFNHLHKPGGGVPICWFKAMQPSFLK